MSTRVSLGAIRAAQEARSIGEVEAWEILDACTSPLRLPWQCVTTTPDGGVWKNLRTGQAVIASVSREPDGRRWLHVSTSFAARLPSYAELCEVKRLFIGADRRALQLFVPTAEHVNIHPHTLHLWHCVDGDGLPDFTGGTGSV